MMIQKSFGQSLKIFASVLLLSGCSGMVFPDFADDTDVIIDDGGKVELRKVNSDGILVADKENAAYDDENENGELFVQNTEEVEKVEPAKTVKIEMASIKPVEKKLSDTEKNAVTEVVETKKLEVREIAAENVVTKEEKYVEQKDEE